MNIIQQFINSLHAPEVIAKFRFQKIGKAILYVFTLMFITTIPIAIILGINFNDLYQDIDRHVKESFPEFSIENGVLTSEIDEPILIEDGNTLIIFDPTGEFTPADTQEYQHAFALLEREAVFVSDHFPQTFGYQQLGISVTKDQLIDIVTSIGNILPLILAIFIIGYYLFLTALKFVGVFALSVITLLLKRNIADNLSYKQGWILSAYAITLPTTLFALIDFIGISIPYSFAIYWVIAIVMMSFTLKYVPSNASTN